MQELAHLLDTIFLVDLSVQRQLPNLTVTEGSCLIGSCDGGGFDAVLARAPEKSAETKMEGVSYAAFV